MAKTDSTTPPPVIPLDPAMNEWVDAWLHEHEPSGIQHDTTVCGFDEIIPPKAAM